MNITMSSVERFAYRPFSLPLTSPKETLQVILSSWIFPVCLILIALFLWFITIPGIDMTRIDDYGLMKITPITYFIGLGLLTLSYAGQVVRKGIPEWLLILHLVALIIMLHGTHMMFFEAPRYSWVYKHIGVISHLQEYEFINPDIDVYHNWPGFFSLGVFLTDWMGLDSSISLANGAQVLFNVLAIPVLRLLFSALTEDKRRVWWAIWLFFITSWVGQDYFAPQALGFFLHIAVVGILFYWLPTRISIADIKVWGWRIARPIVRFTKWIDKRLSRFFSRWKSTRFIIRLYRQPFHEVVSEKGHSDATPDRLLHSAVLVIMFLAICALTASHQLTPFMMIATIGGLVAAWRVRVRSLPIFLLIITIWWMVYMAPAFLSNRSDWYTDVGSVSDNVDNLVDLTQVSAGRNFVATVVRYFTVAVWGLAGLGILRRLFIGKYDLSALIIAVAPFPIFFLQSYGGEILFRVYLFALPGMVYLMAGLFFPSHKIGGSILAYGIRVIAASVLVACFLVAYFGNERTTYFTANEVDGMTYIYENAPFGSLLVMPLFNVPTIFTADYNRFEHEVLTGSYTKVVDGRNFKKQFFDETHLAHLDRAMQARSYNDVYLVISRSQIEYAEQQSVLPIGSIENLEKLVRESSHYALVYENDDLRIYNYYPDYYLPVRGPY